MLERMPPAPSVAWIEDLYRNSVISSISAGLNPPEGESTCEGYDPRKHRSTLASQTVESMYAGLPPQHSAAEVTNMLSSGVRKPYV